jgi:predicted lipoprotein with Yx(FWY)xxD motif
MTPLRFAVPSLAALALLAGCGSSSSTSSSASAGASPYGGGGAAAAATTTTATSSTAAPATPVVLTVKHGKLGAIVATGSRHMTVYLFEADHGAASTCTGTCAKVWPPVLGHPTGTDLPAAHLGTITRADGTVQATFAGHPLYTYAKDGDAGDAYGQGVKSFGADWYVLNPSGAKVDHS